VLKLDDRRDREKQKPPPERGLLVVMLAVSAAGAT
jgi:hypothetical protein